MAQFANHFVFAQLLQRAPLHQLEERSTGQNALVNKSHGFGKLPMDRILRYGHNCVKRGEGWRYRSANSRELRGGTFAYYSRLDPIPRKKDSTGPLESRSPIPEQGKWLQAV